MGRVVRAAGDGVAAAESVGGDRRRDEFGTATRRSRIRGFGVRRYGIVEARRRGLGEAHDARLVFVGVVLTFNEAKRTQRRE